ncbi:hypothetical protein OQA88_771 [Cercophora sp. LCS_1]
MIPPNNVFRGPSSVVDFFDPEKNPPLPLVEIPDRLNPYRKDGVRIYAKLLTTLPAHNVKSLPALKMLRGLPQAQDRTIVEASSGSTVLSLGIIARVLWGHEDVNAYVTNKKHPESLNLLRFFGITPHLYGGLTQQEPTDETGIMCRLRRLVKKRDDVVYPGQYHNEDNWKSHEVWTGPQILQQLPEINIFSTTVGTGGCITGTASYLKSAKPSCTTIGVFNAFGDPTPGPRQFEGFKSCGFPWGPLIDTFVDVSSVDSFRMSMRLSREGLIAGPSSGEALKGLLDYIGEQKNLGQLARHADEITGEISCVFTCSDLPYQYLPQYFQKLGADEFPEIQNQILLKCDQLRHDEGWILEPDKCLEMVRYKPALDIDKNKVSVSSTSLGSDIKEARPVGSGTPSLWSTIRTCFSGLIGSSKEGLRLPGCCATRQTGQPDALPLVLDIRPKAQFEKQHLPGSISMPLEKMTPELADGDLFGDANATFLIWNEIQDMFASSQGKRLIEGLKKSGQSMVVICHDGNASLLATSTMRNRGVDVFNVRGGFERLKLVLY